jgi:beta-glucanase (GH16 family)
MDRKVASVTFVLPTAVAIAALLALALGSFAEAAGAQSAPNCGNAQIPKSTGGTWQCSFSDDFDGTSLDNNKWVPQQSANSGYMSGAGCFVDDPDNVSVSGGSLNLTARQEPGWFWCSIGWAGFPTAWTSGMVTTYRRFSQAYGRFEVRARNSSAKIPGLHSAYWLFPTDMTRYGPWPASGEIDIAELYSQYPDRAIPYIHYNAAQPDPNVTNNNCLIGNPSDFHTYATEWTPTSIKIIYDGKTCLEDSWNPAPPLTKPQPFDQPFMIALTQALGVGTNSFVPGITPLPATTQVDYVHVWK